MKRSQTLEDLADLVRELVDEVRTAERYVRDAAGPYERQTVNQRSGRWFTREDGLLAQLEAAAIPAGTASEDGRRGKPESRPPVSAAFELSCVIITEAAKLRRDLRAALDRPPVRRQHVADDLRAIVGLAAEVDGDTARGALRTVRGWVTAARITLRYDVPIAELREVCCPYCEGPLLVRTDASSDVWCPNQKCRDEDGNRRTWPRSAWVLLLTQMSGPEPDQAQVPA